MIQNTSVALLLEDEALIAMDVEQALESAGFSVTTALTCSAAEEWLRTTRPDVAVVDIRLMDGSSEGIPFVIHSGGSPAHYAETPFASGAWIGKPASRQELVDAVQAALIKTSL
jgi:DNA-binding NtrC family response regulator